MTKLFVLFLALAMLALNMAFLRASAAPETSACSMIVVEPDSGTVLSEKNADKRMLIASTTKILTGLIVLEHCGTDEQIVIGADFPAVPGSSIYLKPGDTMTVSDLLYGMLLESGNDAAVALACHVSGSLEAFSELMNTRAAALGCTNSHFVNPHGLDDKEHYSSARDLALISGEAMKNTTFRDIVSTRSKSAAGRYFKNHNKLLWTYPGAVGIKTGFTESAGRSLVSCVERDGMRLICVTLSASNDWTDHRTLYDWAYSSFRYVRVAGNDGNNAGISVISGLQETVAVQPQTDFAAVYPRKDDVKVTWEIPSFVYAPVFQGEIAGTAVIRKNGQTVMEIPLVYSGDVGLDPSVTLTRWEKFLRSVS